MFRGTTHVWIYLSKLDKLDPSDFEDENEWPIPRDRLGILATVTVRRNKESDELAIRIADQLVSDFGGKITWDGMGYWENLYKAHVAKK